MDDSLVIRAHFEFDERLGHLGKVVIAGGAVRDLRLGFDAKDIDVFILGDPDPSLVTNAIADLDSIDMLVVQASSPDLLGTVEWDGNKVDVVCRKENTVDALLDTFDWNVCLFAFDGFAVRERMRPSEILGGTLALQTLKGKNPESVLRRGFRFVERYGMTMPSDTMVKLCRMVAAQREQQEVEKAQAAR